jgi:hypothetical protein
MHTDLACMQSPSCARHVTCHRLRVPGLLYDFHFLQRWWWQSRVPPAFVTLPFAFICSADHRMLLWEGGVHCKLFWPSFEHIPDCMTKGEFYTVFYCGRGSYSLQNTVFSFCRPHTQTAFWWLVVCCNNFKLACLIFPVSLRLVHAHFCVCLMLHIEWRRPFLLYLVRITPM